MTTLADVILPAGTIGAIPTAGVPGRLYFATDVEGGQWQRDNGSGWDPYLENNAFADLDDVDITSIGGGQTVIWNGGTGKLETPSPTPANVTTSTIADAVAKSAVSALITALNAAGLTAITEI